MAGQSLVELPPQTIRLLGSGQVITSVYSVVKELVENSFDAGCTSIDIKLEGYGLEKIEICDNGQGIKTQDVPYVAKRHYTSKIVTTDDMQSLKTYGFRGEALASLCAVSQVTIATKTPDDEVCYVYDIDSEGNIKGKKPSCLGTGTTVTARNLFFNLKVRKQFYNTSQRKKDDLKKIEDLLIVFAIIRPQMRISLRHDRDMVWQKIQTSDTKEALHSVLSRQVSSQFVCVEKSMEEQQGSVCAYVPKPGSDLKLMSRSTADRTLIVVNDRPVHIKELVKVLRQYYCNCHGCDTNRFPICYVHVKLSAADVDVNVDPNKTTVFFKHLSEVRTCLEELLLKIYGPLDNVPSWHYSDAEKNTQEQKSEKTSIGVVSASVGRKLLGKAAGNEMRSQVTSDIHKNNDASSTHQEEDVSTPQPLPSSTLTFHNSEQSSSKHSEVNVDPKSIHHRRTDTSSAADMTIVNNTMTVDQCSSDAAVTDVALEPCAHSKESHSSATESVNDYSSLVISSEIGTFAKEKSISGQSSELESSTTKKKLPDNHNTEQASGHDLDTDCRENVQASAGSKDCTDNVQASAGSKDCTEIVQASAGSKDCTDNVQASAGSKDCTDNVQASAESKDCTANVQAGAGSKDCTENVQAGAGSNEKVTGMAWSMGLGINTDDGGQLQPVKLLSSSSVETSRKRLPSSDDSSPSKRPTKERKISANQPVKLLSSSLEETPQKRSSSSDSPPSKRLAKGKKISANNGQSENKKTSDKKTLKRRLYQSEKKLECGVEELRAAFLKREMEPNRIFFEIPTVIGQAESCDAWFCGQGGTLSLVNIYRLGEAVLYRNLKNKHRLPSKLRQSPTDLSSLHLNDSLWQTLEQLARSCETRDTYFHISDERLVANGFDIRCHRDPDGKLFAELVGMCDLIPAYMIGDLTEVLEMISKNPQVTLGDARPTKVLYYLQ
ncbi:hypothetical protein BsWGS_01593 [Bradybaena similaris]